MSLISSLSEAQLQDKVNFIENYKQAFNPADGSTVDANANVTLKNISTLEAGNRIDERLFHPGKPQADDGQNHPTVRQ